MSHIIASPFGFGFPYDSLFHVPKRAESNRFKSSRPSEYFWEKATKVSTDEEKKQAEGLDSNWLDDDVSAISDDETPKLLNSDPVPERKKRESISKPAPKKRFSRFRQIAFRAFIPRDGKFNRKSTVIATEVVSKTTTVQSSKDKSKRFGGPEESKKRFTIFNSMRFKTRGATTEVKNMVAVIRHRISSKSPPEQHPKTWEDYHRMYAEEKIDILDPPLPPVEQAPEGEEPTAYHKRFYMAPRPANDSVRQLVINRLGLYGPRGFDSSEEAASRAKERTEIGDKLEENGRAPTSLDMSWDNLSSSSQGSQFGVDDTRAMIKGVRSGELPPETLEQHPVFRKIVKQCRDMFGAAFSMLTILDDDRQIFLAEASAGGVREVTRDITFCAHTILSGRKGFTILDTHKDWRFENGPLVQEYKARFYAGVPLMAPNLDGSSESEEAACPIGTLCVVDMKPRDSFGVDERKKLVYMAEYARREIEKWFAKKMEQKMKILEASQEAWVEQVKNVETTDESHEARDEVLSDAEHVDVTGSSALNSSSLSPASAKPRSFGRFKSSASAVSTPPTSPSSHGNMSLKSPGPLPRPSLFDDITLAIKPKTQKILDLATKLVSDTLDLSLVYLVAVAPPANSESGKTIIISGYNIPLPVPILDPELHLKALNAPEGGLLYQNPSLQEIKEHSLNPLDSVQKEEVESGDSSANSNPGAHCSAILVSVSKELGDNV
ncbi:hypothetical protein PPACK8108_LOCUS2357, partial [Phakopsora pachyrhizi]